MRPTCHDCGREISTSGALTGQCSRCLLELARFRETSGERGRFGSYVLVRRLGSGPLGVVHEVVEPSSGRRLALKRWSVDPSTDGIVEEQPIPVEHRPGIVRVEARGQRDGTRWIAMELMALGSLRAWIEAAHEAEQPRRVLARFAPAAAALARAHDQGIVHAGIKPENLLLGDDGTLRLADFQPDNGTALAALAGAETGTVYLAPEQAQATERATAATDVWALAACSTEALRATTAVPRSVARLLRDCLKEDPRARPPASALAEAFSVAPTRNTSASLLARARRLLRR